MSSVRSLLHEKKHFKICEWVIKEFPGLFGFQHCGILLVDPVTKELFQLQFRTATTPAYKDEDSIILFSKQVGCTGQAITTRKSVLFNPNEISRFCHEVDNAVNCPRVSSFLCCPIYDSQSELRGVLQLINHCDQNIQRRHVTEVESLTVALGEAIKYADEIKRFTNVSCAVTKQLYTNRELMLGKIEALEQAQRMQSFGAKYKKVAQLVECLAQVKKDAIFSDK